MGLANSQGGSDNLYIMIDDVQLEQCRGQPNHIKIRKEDVEILDDNGDKVHYIRAPGQYKINFNRVQPDKKLPYISGEMSALLEVPLVESSFIRFDFPYSIIPEKQLVNDVCDKESGVVVKNVNGQKRSFCRYCSLCDTLARTENTLDQKQFLPDLEKNKEEYSFRRICTRIDSKSYSIARTIKLPGKRQLEAEANRQFGGVGSEVKKRFNKGKGRFRVRLHLLSSNNPPKSYQETQKQRCSNGGLLGSLTCGLQCRIPGVGENCKAYYAENCISNEEMVACYSVVFYYRVTQNYAEVRQFLAKKGLKDNWVGSSNPQPSQPSQPSQPRPSQPTGGQTSGQTSGQGSSSTGTQGSSTSGDYRSICVNRIRSERIKRFCQRAVSSGRWNPQCCRYCPGVCPNTGRRAFFRRQG